MPLGIYISIPFCRTKCSYCNFASDVFSRAIFERYVDRMCADIASAPLTAIEMGGQLERNVDSIYLGGGTPTLLDAAQLERIFATVRSRFDVSPEAEVTVECAPGTLADAMVETLLRCGVNRVSLGVQSLVDQEAAAVGRLHKRTTVIGDIDRLRAAGITNINIDLIAGLPHQTAETWEFSLTQAIATGVPHISVYMLEVDEDSRLGGELLASGTRYHAHFVPTDESIAGCYLAACQRLKAAGIAQYEISNFARSGFESRHNLKYWTRQPYFGFGMDAHSMLLSPEPVEHPSSESGIGAVRFASPDSLEKYMNGISLQKTFISHRAALEESFFLGLRLTRGVSLPEIATNFGHAALTNAQPTIAGLVEDGLLLSDGESIRLTSRGQMVSNDVFERFLVPDEVTR